MSNASMRHLSLSARQWAALERLAVETDSREPVGRGHDPRLFKWQRLIRRIADGELLLSERAPYKLPPGLAEAAAAVEERQREQAVQRKTPVKMEQLSILDLEPA
jgi:hypothetical protein